MPTHTAASITHVIDAFLSAKIDERRSVRTIETYRFRLGMFADWLQDKPLTRTTLRAYLAYLQSRSLHPVTVAGWFRDVVTFLNWIIKENEERESSGEAPLPIVLGRNPARGLIPKVPRYRPASYSVEHLQRLLAVCSTRDAALMLVLLDTGLRASELCSMRRDTIDYATRHFTIIGKGDKERSGRVSHRALDAIRAYLNERTDNDPALWYGRVGPLTSGGVHKIISRRAQQIGIRGEVRRLIHSFRATFAKHLRKRKASLDTIADLLGHSTLDMARHYAQLADDEVLDLKDQIDPLGELYPDDAGSNRAMTEPMFTPQQPPIGGWHDADLDRLIADAQHMRVGWVRGALLMQVREEARRRGDPATAQRAEHLLIASEGGPVQVSCSWCHTMNDTETRYCTTCGHEAHAPRMRCRCQQCSAALKHTER